MKVQLRKYALALAQSLKTEKDKNEIERKIQNLFKILVKNKQGKSITRFEKEFGNVWREVNGQLEATVTLPYEPSDEDKMSLMKLLGEALNKEIILNVKVDENVIGGMKIEFDDCIIDATVQKNLELLKQSINS
ncbi:MAG TPA: ATP synthase F1 subunit delta [Candidatus Gracilibacteria bacterium]|nr:ATP synthase F1 subunit delta [Candidatus Gracilibacteria bacterium]